MTINNEIEESKIDKTKIISIISTILTDAHEPGIKREVLDKGDRLNFACPICGDSQKNNRQKRCWLFLNSLRYSCYNEGCHGSLDWLAKKFNITVSPDDRTAIRTIITKSRDNIKINRVQPDIPKEKISFSQSEILEAYPELINFSFPSKGTVRKYLLLRGVNPNKFASADLKISDDWIEPVIVILNASKDGTRIIGYQTRNLKSGRARKYSTHLWSELYEQIKGETALDMVKDYYDPLSEMYGIMSVDMNQPVTVFEGYMDASLFPNAIGLSGAKTNIQPLIDAGADVRFIYDNDKTGYAVALSKLKAGCSVFLWQKLIHDLSKREKDPWSFRSWFNKNIIDWGDLTKAGILDFNPDLYFSRDLFDIIWFENKS